MLRDDAQFTDGPEPGNVHDRKLERTRLKFGWIGSVVVAVDGGEHRQRIAGRPHVVHTQDPGAALRGEHRGGDRARRALGDRDGR